MTSAFLVPCWPCCRFCYRSKGQGVSLFVLQFLSSHACLSCIYFVCSLFFLNFCIFASSWMNGKNSCCPLWDIYLVFPFFTPTLELVEFILSPMHFCVQACLDAQFTCMKDKVVMYCRLPLCFPILCLPMFPFMCPQGFPCVWCKLWEVGWISHPKFEIGEDTIIFGFGRGFMYMPIYF